MARHILPVKVDLGTGAPLVLLHGLGNNHNSWQFVLKHLDYTRWHAIAPDLLGFGDAPKPDDVDYTPDDHAEAVIATLDAMGIERAVFAGHSMGCLVALRIADRWPERTDGLLLLGAPLYARRPRGGRLRRMLRAEGLYFSLFEVVEQNPDAVQAGGDLAEDLLPFVKGMEITEETWPAFRASLEHTIMQFDSFRQAVRLTVPAVFVTGFLDMFVIRRNVVAAHRRNRRHTRLVRTLGPHELTPRQGRTVSRILDRHARLFGAG